MTRSHWNQRRRRRPWSPACLAFAALVGAAAGGPARAEEAGKGKDFKGDTTTFSSPPPSVEGSFAPDIATNTSRSVSVEDEVGLFDAAPGKRRKWFDIGGTWETHALLWCIDSTCASNGSAKKLFNYAFGYASLLLTRNDRIRVRAGFYEYLLADPGESGIRASDLSLTYAHLFRLPSNFALRGTIGLTAPISFNSQKAGLITSPSVQLALTHAFKDIGLSEELNVFAGGNIQACSSAGGYNCQTPGGAPNSLAATGGSIEIDYSFWFLKSLTLGVDGYLTWLWTRDVSDVQPMSGGCVNYGYGCSYPGATGDKNFSHQPWQQVYGFEAFLRYSLPKFHHIQVDIQAAIAEGDPTLGSVSYNIDGVSRAWLDYFSAFEVYGTVLARY